MKTVQTLEVNGETIKIKAKVWNYCRNFAGWIFDINGVKIKVSELDFDKAKDYAFAKFVKENR